MMEVQGVAAERNSAFPYSGLRVLGFIQLVNGAVIFIIGVIDLSIMMASYDDGKGGDSRYDLIVTMTVVSVPLWSGMWFALTGSMGTCFSRKRFHAVYVFKIAFLVLNILCAALFGPACAVVCGLIALVRHDIDPSDYQWMATFLLCFLGVLEIFLASAASSLLCCCSPINGTQVQILVAGDTLKRKVHPQSMPYNTTTGNNMIKDDSWDYDGFQASPVSSKSKVQPRAEIDEPKHNEIDNHARPGRPLPQDRPQHLEEHPQHKYDGFGDAESNTGSYSQLKKWALPTW